MSYPCSAADEDLLLYNLGIKGFPLMEFDYETSRPVIPTHELIIRMVRDYKDPRATEGLALAIENQPPEYGALVHDALKHNVQNEVGYVLEGTLGVLKRHRPDLNLSELENAVAILFARKDSHDHFLTRIDLPNENEILSRNRASEDFRWNIKGGITFGQLDIQYRAYHGIRY